MEETLNANSASLQIYLDELAKSFGGMEGAMSMLGRTIQRDAFVMTRSEEHTSEPQSLMRISYAVFCLKKKTTTIQYQSEQQNTTHASQNKSIHPINLTICTFIQPTK